MFEYRARLVRVVDGDTLDLTLDLGFGIIRTDRFRLFGLNAPELSTGEGIRGRGGYDSPAGFRFARGVGSSSAMA